MAAEEYLRLAWHADRDGRQGMRDALLTLAVAESGPENAVLAERCRRRLVAGRPDHWFASFPTMGEALAHPRVVDALREIRAVYPPVRVRHLLLRLDALRGPYSKRPRPLSRVVDDLVGPQKRRRRIQEAPAIPFPDDPTSAAAVTTFYLTILLAIAIFMESTLKPASQEKAA